MSGCLLRIYSDGEVHVQPVTLAGTTRAGDEVYGFTGEKWRQVGTVRQGVVRPDGSLDTKRWVAVGITGGGRHEAGSKAAAVNALLENLDLYVVDDDETIPPLFG